MRDNETRRGEMILTGIKYLFPFAVLSLKVHFISYLKD